MQARTDELTGLLSRNYFYEMLNKVYEENPNELLSLVLVSMDDFKLYNQLYGFEEGDIALKNVATIISNSIGECGHAAHYEGKTFAIMLPKMDTISAYNLAENIRKRVMEMDCKIPVHSLKTLTCSCGVCTIPFGASAPRMLLNNADLAVYNAKRNGKNCTRTYYEGNNAEKKILATEHSINFKANVYEEYATTIYALTAAIDTKDHYTFSHSQNVCYYAAELAKGYGLDDDCVEIVKEAALLHDVGKIGIPENILRKPGKLTDEEYTVIKSHVEQSIGIIRYLPSLDYVIPAVIGHHERYDGKGYPRGLKGEQIPVLARILCIADSFDAMISKRSYKESYPLDYAIKQLEECAGSQFDPVLVPIFVMLLKTQQIAVQRSYMELAQEA